MTGVKSQPYRLHEYDVRSVVTVAPADVMGTQKPVA